MTAAGDQPTASRGAGVEPDDQARFVPGQRLAGRYRIVAPIGRGGMGEVYRADDLQLGDRVALKFLPSAIARDASWLARLRNEVRLAHRVTHPNVCRVHDLVESDGEQFIAMELVDGEDLASLLRRIGRVPDDKAIEIARQLCMGMAAAHGHGVLHRDLKPANVMIDGRGDVRITDFGVATLADRAAEAEQAGTPAYMAPEQLAGKAATPRSDIYALGLVLHEVFTGTAATGGEAPPARPETDPAVEQVILRCLEQDPHRRPASVLEVAAALPGGDPLAAALAAGETPSPELVAASGRREAMSPAAAIALVTLLALALVATVPLKSERSLYGHVPLDKPPAALADRAQEVLARAGYGTEPGETAIGYGFIWRYARWSERQPDAPPLRERLARARPPTMVFWYRQAPGRFHPRRTTWHPRGRVSALDPRWSVPGEAYVSLDLAGRLRRFYVIPSLHYSPEDLPERADPVDWTTLFDLAGLEIDRFHSVEPRYEVQFRVDRRVAWTGVLPEDTDIPLRVEAGVTEGRPAYFRFVSPWDEPALLASTAIVEPELEAGILGRAGDVLVQSLRRGILGTLVGLALVVVAIVLAYRNRRLGRSDRRGAARLAIYAFAASLLTIVVGSPRVALEEADDVARVLAPPVLLAVIAWVCYLGLEPYARKQWPTTLVAWTRLLSGRVRDPLVGRSVLVGALFGVVGTLVFTLVWHVAVWAGDASPWPQEGGFATATAMRLPFSDGLLVMPVLLGFVYLLLLVALRYILRLQWLAALAFALVAPLIFDARSIDLMPWSYGAGILWTGMIVVLMLRLGVLAVVVCVFCDALLWLAPLTPDLSAWFASATIAVVLTLAALVAVGTWMSVTSPRPGLH